MIHSTMKCSECGEELRVTSRRAKTNNLGDVEELIMFVQPCKCAGQQPETQGDDIPMNCERCGDVISILDAALDPSDGCSMVCGFCEVIPC